MRLFRCCDRDVQSHELPWVQRWRGRFAKMTERQHGIRALMVTCPHCRSSHTLTDRKTAAKLRKEAA